MAAFPIIIFHNPACGTSRNTVQAVRDAGFAPEVVEYLKVGWTRSQLETLLKAAGLTPRQALRERGSPAGELGLLDGASDEAILDAMVSHPILVNRPIVSTPLGVRLCRPAEVVRELLPR